MLKQMCLIKVRKSELKIIKLNYIRKIITQSHIAQ